jgi:hypothetical protein
MDRQPGKSPAVEGSSGYERKCLDCGHIMRWVWGGEITYFECDCWRIEPCANVIIEGTKLTVESGNKKVTAELKPGERDSILKRLLKGVP